MSKQFEIKNISEQEIYFRTKWKDQQSFLVAISPRNQQWIQIRKEPTGARSLTITRTLYQHRSPQESFFKHPLFASSRREENIFMSEQRFDSLYHKKNYEFR